VLSKPPSARTRALARLVLTTLLLVACLVVYRPLLPAGWAWPSRARLEDWLFAPEHKTPLLALGVAAWLVWRRRATLRSLPDARAPWTAAALLAVAASCYAWTLHHPSIALLLLSLSANLLALASAAKGPAGLRALLVPAAVLLLGAPLPDILRDPLVWKLQLLTAGGASWLLEATGFDVQRSGAIQMRRAPYNFTVIPSCSGLRGIEILTLLGVAIRERFVASGRRQWLVVLAAPAIGLVLNLARVFVVVAVTSTIEPRQPDTGINNHALQGLALLLVGAGLLQALARWLAGSAHRPASRRGRRRPRETPARPRRRCPSP
jgi:exosortase